MLVNLCNNFIVVDFTSCNDNEVVTEVVSGMEVTEVVYTDCMSQISVTSGWLAKHVFSERVVVDVGKKGLFISCVVGLMLLADVVLEEFKLSRVKGHIAYHISEKSNSLGGVALEDLEAIAYLFFVNFSSVLGSHVFNLGG
jgi:hypothetical protein